VHALALADEQRDPKVLLQLPYARRHIGLDAMQTSRRARHAAFLRDGQEDAENGEIHSSLLENISIMIIHFPKRWSIAISRAPEATTAWQEAYAMVADIMRRAQAQAQARAVPVGAVA
jgi:hypothetical protein